MDEIEETFFETTKQNKTKSYLDGEMDWMNILFSIGILTGLTDLPRSSDTQDWPERLF